MLNGLFSLISARPLGLARIMVGGAAAIRSVIAWPVLFGLAEPDALRLPYADWLPAPSMPLVTALAAVWLVSAVLFSLGWKVNVFGPLLLVSLVLNLVLDQQTYGNHVYLMAWLVLLLLIADAGAGLNAGRTDRPVTRWPVLLLMIQLSVVYGFSAITKFNPDFLSGEVLAGLLGTGILPFPESLRTPSVLMVVAASALVVELFVAIFIWRPRFRPAAFVLGFGLHLAITLFIFDTLILLVFSLEMLALYPLFLSSQRIAVVWDDDCGSCRSWVERFQRFDVLRLLNPIPKTSEDNPVPAADVERAMHVVDDLGVARGFAAVERIGERLVPTLWFAPIARLPGLRGLGERWYRWQASRRSCAVGLPRESDQTGIADGR